MSWSSLISRLPQVRGKYVENAPLADVTWLRVGGPAQVLYLPADEADLARFLAETPEDIPVTILGAGSNTLVRDGGVPGVTVRLTGTMDRARVRRHNDRVGIPDLKSGSAAARCVFRPLLRRRRRPPGALWRCPSIMFYSVFRE